MKEIDSVTALDCAETLARYCGERKCKNCVFYTDGCTFNVKSIPELWRLPTVIRSRGISKTPFGLFITEAERYKDDEEH